MTREEPVAQLRLWREGAVLIVEVADHGTGFDPERLSGPEGAAPGFGLFSIRERVRSFGGEMTLRSAPGAGAAVRLTLPVEA